MQQKIRTPRQSLLKGFITLPVSKEDIGLFKQELQLLADRIKIEESEEYNKNLIMQFLNRTYYVRQGYMVNTYGKTDMAIYTDSAEGRKPVVLFERTVLTDAHGHRLSGQINELEYLFRFLDAFDFGETGRTQVMIAERSKALIDASVLGLIFEKINGYKDGSIFTPGYITQHICETAIRQAVVEQFNRKKGWHCQTLEEVEDHLEPLNRDTRTEATARGAQCAGQGGRRSRCRRRLAVRQRAPDN